VCNDGRSCGADISFNVVATVRTTIAPAAEIVEALFPPGKLCTSKLDANNVHG
jgi:hypothetical protein